MYVCTYILKLIFVPFQLRDLNHLSKLINITLLFSKIFFLTISEPNFINKAKKNFLDLLTTTYIMKYYRKNFNSSFDFLYQCTGRPMGVFC